MKKTIGLVSLLILFTYSCATIENRKADRQATIETTHTWFTYLDKMDYEELWEISSDLLKLKIKKEDFLRDLRGVREPLGTVIDRDLQLNQIVTIIRHYPDGNYRKIVYWSKYKNKKFVRETFLLIKEGDRWGVLRYDFM